MAKLLDAFRWLSANIELSIDEIQSYLDKRKPGQSKYTTQRKEDDKIEILSGTIKSNSETISQPEPLYLF